MFTRIPTQHAVTEYREGQLHRPDSPAFRPPVPNGMREPGTSYVSILTAPDHQYSAK